ncbi:MAG: group II intron maturase-specific domain-containing protein [Calditrichota bacterium]
MRKYNGKLLVKPSKASIKGFWLEARQIFQQHRSVSADALIGRLNPVIRGWANYYQHVASKKTFRQLGNLLWKKSWRWASRRHPRKSRRRLIQRDDLEGTDRRRKGACRAEERNYHYRVKPFTPLFKRGVSIEASTFV